MRAAGFDDVRVQTVPGWQQHIVHTVLGRRPFEQEANALADPDAPTNPEGLPTTADPEAATPPLGMDLPNRTPPPDPAPA